MAMTTTVTMVTVTVLAMLLVMAMVTVMTVLLGNLRNHDGNANENVAWKYKFSLLVLLRDYSNSYNLYNMAELSSNRTGGNDV